MLVLEEGRDTLGLKKRAAHLGVPGTHMPLGDRKSILSVHEV